MREHRNSSVIKAVLLTGLLVTFLIAAGTTINYLAAGGKNPVQLLNFVASGIFGHDALDGEIGSMRQMAALGLLLHTLISICWVAIFFVVYCRFILLKGNHWLSGLGYGVFIWLTMAFAVLPVSNTTPVVVTWPGALWDLLIITVGAGIPASLAAKMYFNSASQGGLHRE